MTPLTHEEKLKVLKDLYWDYFIDPQEYFDIVEGRIEGDRWLNREHILIRMFERLYWYTLVAFFGLNGLKTLITPEVIAKLRFPFMRHKYEYIRKVLHGEPISDSGWRAPRSEELRDSVLSDRWYRSQQTLP